VRNAICSHCGLTVSGRAIVQTSADGDRLDSVEHPICEDALFSEARRGRTG
jgi:hypothetical protein